MSTGDVFLVQRHPGLRWPFAVHAHLPGGSSTNVSGHGRRSFARAHAMAREAEACLALDLRRWLVAAAS